MGGSQAVLEEAMEQPVTQAFADFDSEPLASAGITGFIRHA